MVTGQRGRAVRATKDGARITGVGTVQGLALLQDNDGCRAHLLTSNSVEEGRVDFAERAFESALDGGAAAAPVIDLQEAAAHGWSEVLVKVLSALPTPVAVKHAKQIRRWQTILAQQRARRDVLVLHLPSQPFHRAASKCGALGRACRVIEGV